MSVNALSVYVSTCRLALQSTSAIPGDAEAEESNANEQQSAGLTSNNNANSHSWTELYRLLPCLRQSLTCALCGRIAADPIASTQAFKCRSCAVKSSTAEPAGDAQGKILVQCYRKLCQYLESTNFYRKLGNLSANGGTRSLAELIREGASLAVQSELANSQKVQRPTGSLLSRLLAQPPLPSLTQNYNSGHATSTPDCNGPNPDASGACDIGMSNGLPLTSSNLYSVSLTGMHSTRITIKREQGSKPTPGYDDAASSSSSTSPSSSSSTGSELLVPAAEMAARRATKRKSCAKVINRIAYQRRNSRVGSVTRPSTSAATAASKRRECRCGNASRHPGKLTCCGQRCPCYAEGLACIKCKCRGCKNPRSHSALKSASSTSSLSSSSSSSSDNLPLHPARNKTNKSKCNSKNCNSNGDSG